VGQQRQELYAFAPLGTVPWGVVARQPAEQAWAFAGALVRNVTLLAASLFSLALLFAWGAALSVTRPLSTLTHAAERISRGELETPIPPLPGDEVGRLGASLEVMRRSLSASVQHIARANVELEHRVEERTAQLHTLNQELEARERARTRLLRQVLAAEDAERKRIARELHDETCQSLSALVMGLHGAAATLPPEGRARVEEASTLATRTLAEVHRLIVDLRPSVLDDLGLESALAWAADRTLTSRGLTARCEFSGLERRLPRDVESALFRIAQEAMTNIARHAGAETVLIQCARRDGRVTLDIEDDGHGFDVQALGRPDSSGRGLGLMGMRERGELIGGSLVLESTPGQGTHVSLTVPVPLDEEVSHG
jgi:signal transduction histidine kinase